MACGLLTVVGSLAAEQGLSVGKLSSCGAGALLPCGVWSLSRPEIESVPPALVDGFLTTGPPEKSLLVSSSSNKYSPYALITTICVSECVCVIV